MQACFYWPMPQAAGVAHLSSDQESCCRGTVLCLRCTSGEVQEPGKCSTAWFLVYQELIAMTEA